MSKLTSDELKNQMAAFLAKGGSVEVVESGSRVLSEREVHAKTSGRDDLADSYTDKRMRAAENQEGVHSAYFV